MENVNNQNGTSSILVIIMICLIAVCVIGFNIAGNSLHKEAKAKTKDSQVQERIKEEEKKLCAGKYYGEAKGSRGVMKYNYKYTYELKEDGTFTANLDDAEVESGNFTILNGTIMFKYNPQGASSKAGAVETYSITDDCSSIMYDESIGFKLDLVK